MKTATATLDEIRVWARRVAARNLRREGYTLRVSYIVKKVKEAALWTDGRYFDLPQFWKATIGWKVTS